MLSVYDVLRPRGVWSILTGLIRIGPVAAYVFTGDLGRALRIGERIEQAWSA